MVLLQMLTEDKIDFVVHYAGINQTLIEMSQEYTKNQINLTLKTGLGSKVGFCISLDHLVINSVIVASVDCW
jgi:hypothetical protein